MLESPNKANKREGKTMNLWEHEESVTEHGVSVPVWMEDVSCYDVAAICEGGCASGAYMPAVTYSQANATMAEHGDDVLDYLQEAYGELPTPPNDVSWSGLAVFYLSPAVEAWANGAYAELEDL